MVTSGQLTCFTWLKFECYHLIYWSEIYVYIMPKYFHTCLLTFANCVIWVIIFRRLFVAFIYGLVHICSAIWITANLECVLCHLMLILSSSSTQVEHYLEPYLLIESNWNIGVEGMVVATVNCSD